MPTVAGKTLKRLRVDTGTGMYCRCGILQRPDKKQEAFAADRQIAWLAPTELLPDLQTAFRHDMCLLSLLHENHGARTSSSRIDPPAPSIAFAAPGCHGQTGCAGFASFPGRLPWRALPAVGQCRALQLSSSTTQCWELQLRVAALRRSRMACGRYEADLGNRRCGALSAFNPTL